MVLLLMVIAVATIGWSITRTSAQTAVVAMQVNEYQRHHEMLGVRSIVRDWLNDSDVRDSLPFHARHGEIVHVLELPTGELISLAVQDGQGTALARLDIAMNENQRALQIDILSRIPRDDPRFTRGFGPVKISLKGAPPEIILAAARGNHNLANTLNDLRARPELNRAQFLTELRNAGFTGGEGQELLSIFDLNTILWRVNVEVVSDRALNRYTLLAQVEGNIVQILEWRALPEGTDFQTQFLPPEPPRSGAAGRGTTTSR